MQAENLINISFIISNKIYIENKKTKKPTAGVWIWPTSRGWRPTIGTSPVVFVTSRVRDDTRLVGRLPVTFIGGA
jgi:hypothetical protein